MQLDKDEKIIRWCISVVLTVFAIINGFKIASLILIMVAVIALPIKPITDVMLNLKPMVAVVISLSLILIGVVTMPDSSTSAGGINKYPSNNNKPVVDNSFNDTLNDSQTSTDGDNNNTTDTSSGGSPTPDSTTDNGEDSKEDEENKEEDIPLDNVPADYVLNKSSLKFHLPTCYMVKRIDDKNKATYSGDRDYLIREGYEPCGHCDP